MNAIMNSRWSLKKNNRGASLIAVLVTIMFVSLIGVVISQITITNIQMKEVEQKSKKNFYNAEMALDDLSAGLNTKAAECMQKAYSEVLSKYRTVTATGGNVQGNFGRNYIDNMIAVFGSSESGAPMQTKDAEGVVTYQIGTYKLAAINDAFSSDAYRSMLKTVPSGSLTESVQYYYADYNAGTFVLSGIKLQSLDSTTGYVTNIQTDMVFTVPPLDFEASYTVKEFMRYSLIANKSINVNSSHVVVDGNVYAGPGGIFSDTGTVANSKFIGKTIVTRGDIASTGAEFTVGNENKKSNIWVENIKTYGGAHTQLTLRGNIFVSDDLEMDGKNGTVNLEGFYYGYNFQKNYGASSTGDGSEYSSAIALNGRSSKLNMTGLNQLMLAGRTYLKRKYGTTDVGEADVPLGESLSIRTNQMAYYVPSGFLEFPAPGTEGNPTFTNAGEVSRYLGVGNVLDYVSEANPVTAFHYIKNGSGDKGTSYYLKFASKTVGATNISEEQSANNFFAEFYANNKGKISAYSEIYAENDGIILPNTDGTLDILLTLKGDIMYRMAARASDSAPSNINVGRIEISATNLDTVDFRNYAGRLAVKYKSLQMYLEESHTGITASDVRFGENNDKNANPLLENLLAPASDTEHFKYAFQEAVKDQSGKKIEQRYNESGVKTEGGSYAVIIVDNGDDLFTVDQSYDGGIIIASGDVQLATAASGEGGVVSPHAFNGVIISGGTISFATNASVNANELLVSQLFVNDLRSSNRFFSQFFKGYEIVSDAEMGTVKIDRYLSYDNWTKSID